MSDNNSKRIVDVLVEKGVVKSNAEANRMKENIDAGRSDQTFNILVATFIDVLRGGR